MNTSFDCLIVGAGAAGLMAAIECGKRGRRVLLLEKNSKPGAKILMSGGTRCNLTQDTDTPSLIAAFGKEGRFLHSALAAFSNHDLIAYFNEQGVPTKVEPTGKVFPRSDRAKDVLDALVQDAYEKNAKLNLQEPVHSISYEQSMFLVHTKKAVYQVPQLLITTGGRSFPGCGTTGDGYQWCQQFGHTIIDPVPALVPLKTPDQCWTRNLQGVTLSDVNLTLFDSSQVMLAQTRGPTLFTHRGISGPAPMNISKAVSHNDGQALSLQFDFLPDLNREQKRLCLLELVRSHPKKQIGTALKGLLPMRVTNLLLQQATIAPDKRCAEVSKENLQQLVETLHSLPATITGTLGFAKAEVTAGGVQLSEVNSKTMESKCRPGLFLAGEILNLDGPIGGYNFTAAFATGFLAGQYL